MIDLRDVERKLSLARSKSEAIDQEFSRSPTEGKSRSHATGNDAGRRTGDGQGPVLSGPALEEMTEAQATPMEMPRKESLGWLDYMIGEDEWDPRHPSDFNPPQQGFSPGSLSSGRGSWSSTAKKTWGTLRGLSGDVLSHLPKPSDLLGPPDDEEFHDFQAALSTSPEQKVGKTQRQPRAPPERAGTTPGRVFDERSSGKTHDEKGSDRPKSPSKRWLFGTGPPNASTGHLASSWHSAMGSDGSAASHGHPHGPSSTAGPGIVPISGAPGFDARESKQWNTGHWKMEEKEKVRSYIPVNMVGRRDITAEVIEPWHAARLQAGLPPRLQLGKTWRLLYSLDQHGTSLSTLYHNVAKGLDPAQGRKAAVGADAEGWLRGASAATREALGTTGGIGKVGSGLSIPDAGLIIAVKDAEDNVFGAFVNETLRPSSHYYGNGECFLWKTTCDNPLDASSDTEHAHKRIKTFKWTARNDYMVLTEAHFLSVGGGDGRYGLWIDDALENGVSSRCPTFDNDILCNDSSARTGPEEKESRFECLNIEVWAVGAD